MTFFTLLSITPLLCNTASKLNLTIHKNSTCYQLTTKTAHCKIIKKPSDFRIKEATGGVLLKKVFLKILQYLQENTCARVSF